MPCRTALKKMPQFAIGVGVTSTLAYLLYRYVLSAILIDVAYEGIGTLGTLASPDLAPKACPKQAEGMVFALFMSLDNGSVQRSRIVGGWLYDAFGYAWLILLSAACTALCWLLVPLVRVEQVAALAAAPDLTRGPPVSYTGDHRMGSEDGGDLLSMRLPTGTWRNAAQKVTPPAVPSPRIQEVAATGNGHSV
jgi:MFS family permease